MAGNIYVLDIKKTPDDKLYLIEIGGQEGGTDGFVEAYGDLRTQQAILSAMNSFGNGKPLYAQTEPNDSEISFKFIKGLIILSMRSSTFPIRYTARHVLDLRDEWVMKPYETTFGKYDDVTAKEKYKIAAQQLDIDFRQFTDLKLHNAQTLRIELESGDYNFVHPEEIGLIRSGHDIFSRTNEFDDVLANPFVIERLINTKLYVHRLLEGSELEEHLPKSAPYGMGLLHELPIDWSEDKVVYKPNSARAGQGVRIWSPEQMKLVMHPERAPLANKLLRNFFNFKWKPQPITEAALLGMEHFSYIIQEFIPSEPVTSSQTGLEHDSCMRAVVFNGKFIDAYHRLAPTPLSGPDTNSKYVANLSNGAFAEPLVDEDKDDVAEFSEKVVATLDEKIERLSLTTENDVRQYRKSFWEHELQMVG